MQGRQAEQDWRESPFSAAFVARVQFGPFEAPHSLRHQLTYSFVELPSSRHAVAILKVLLLLLGHLLTIYGRKQQHDYSNSAKQRRSRGNTGQPPAGSELREWPKEGFRKPMTTRESHQGA